MAHFTYGTLWTNVQHAAFGILLCGSFCLILESGRRSWRHVLQATVLGMIFGGIANSCADSGADLVGITAMKSMGDAGQLFGMLAWFIFVPFALSFSITLAIGPTKQRVARAIFSTVVASVFTFVGRIVGSIVGAAMMISTMNVGEVMSGNATSSMEKSVPAWMVEAIFAGVALGLTMMITDRVSRKGSLRLVYGRKEFKDWSLDHAVNRIGSSEVEIMVRGFKGVEPVHACVFRQGSQFMLDCQHFPGFVNGYPVSQALLNDGDMIQLGEAQLVFYSAGAVRSRPQQWNQQPMRHPGTMAPHPGMVPQTGPFPGQPQPGMPIPGMPPGQYPQPMPDQMPVGSPAVQTVPAPEPVAPQPSVPRYFLVDLAGKELPLQMGANSVGREVGNTVCFPANGTVSRAHGNISIEATGAFVSDAGSANGTRLNGTPVTGPTVLSDGDTVSFGSANLTFRVQA